MRLPSERMIAGKLGLSRGTVCSVLEQLKIEGLIVTRQRSGRYVAEGVAEPAAAGRRTDYPAPRLARRADALQAEPVVAVNTERAGAAFQPFAAPLHCFPHRSWLHAIYRARSREFPGHIAHADPLGYRPLRKAIAGHIGLARGISTDPERIAIVPSTQGAFDLLARLLLDPGEVAAVERPGNPVAAALLEAADVQVAPLNVDEQGLDPTDLERQSPRLIYATPTHQLPLGVTLCPPRRHRRIAPGTAPGFRGGQSDADPRGHAARRPRPETACRALGRRG